MNVKSSIRRAFVPAAGLGTRMHPITTTRPKALVEVAGRSLLDHALDRLSAAGVEEAVVNVHHFADMVEGHLKGRKAPKIIISDERDALLETGGGLVKALPLLGDTPFFVVNADTMWLDSVRPNLARLAEAFDESRMDGLLLLASSVGSVGYSGRGDFRLDPLGRLMRRPERDLAPFVYAGAAVISPALLEGAPEGAFSLNRLFDRAIEAERLHGLRLEGMWMHVGTPDAIAEAEDSIARSAA
ncbi:mannose-1-phosphate guanylyltransferase [Agaricicola taiwanensis]|uniref:Mannose-1-phosphate guanylyltransferase n=1 Tax=Agaricicola taiwanensis TaxID=591372 RepID=A0A8J2VN21_9RHOB|nr:nucleotidyltransferase family protein [Agaricicola taiwanensis]GGE32702.1 mannose-1-phosphate guanylyltransferase [Agaricicola taiwanensis]